MQRKNIQEADEILGLKFPVLNHGWVSMVDYCGGDEMIENFARNSYGKGTRPTSDRRALIRYLINHYHTTPIECTEISFDLALPIHVARQLVRHRTFSPINEYSARYSIVPETLYEDYELNLQSKNNKQGRNDEIVNNPDFIEEIKESHKKAFDLYNRMIEAGVAREIARMHLPLNCYTYWFCKMDLNNLFKMLRLRLDSHAQAEIREYAQVIAGITKRVAPMAFEAFFDYHYCGSNLNRMDKLLLEELISAANPNNPVDEEDMNKVGLKLGMTKRETDDFFKKISPSNFKLEDFDLNLSSVIKETESA